MNNRPTNRKVGFPVSCFFDSHIEYFKTAFGALRAGDPLTLTLQIPTSFGAVAPRLALYQEGADDALSHHKMEHLKTEHDLQIFTITLHPTAVGLHFYWFDLYSDFRCIWKDENGQGVLGWSKGEIHHPTAEMWQLTVYEADFTTPDNYKGKVFYQIFPDRFCQGVQRPMPFADRFYQPDKTAEPAWQPTEEGGKLTLDYYGGDFAGIAQKLPYLQEMGVDYIYLNPIFEAHSNHRYNTADYLHVDPLLGTDEEFTALCNTAKGYGIGFVLDGVFSHTGDDSLYFNKYNRYGQGGAFHNENSPYRSWFNFSPDYGCGYRSWWGFSTLPEVTEDDPAYVGFITGEGGVIDTWLQRGAAGFRLDVADELPDDFIEKIRTAVKRNGTDKLLIGEVWEDATTKIAYDKRRTYLLGKGLDTVMNYPFQNAVLDFMVGQSAEETAREILSVCENYPAPALHTLFNFLSTHDTERALTRMADEPSHNRGRDWQSGRKLTGEAYEHGMNLLKLAYTMIFTLPGLPSVYYGDEIGMQGYRDPFNRAYFDWNSAEQRLRPVLSQLAELRHTCEAFAEGKLEVVTAEGRFLHYRRVGKTETAEILINLTDHIRVEMVNDKATMVNPMGSTILVEEIGHNRDHSYFDYS